MGTYKRHSNGYYLLSKLTKEEKTKKETYKKTLEDKLINWLAKENKDNDETE